MSIAKILFIDHKIKFIMGESKITWLVRKVHVKIKEIHLIEHVVECPSFQSDIQSLC